LDEADIGVVGLFTDEFRVVGHDGSLADFVEILNEGLVTGDHQRITDGNLIVDQRSLKGGYLLRMGFLMLV
jgi:hypothetical protein